jgi:hypothetical protein
MPEILRQTNDFAASLKLTPPRDPLPLPFWQAHGWELAGLFGLVVCGVALWFRLGRRTRLQAAIPPARQARSELEALRGRVPDIKLAIEAARIIRRFIVNRLALPPDELTTTELCAALRNRPGVAPETADRATDFLRRCDELKFAPDAKSPESDLIAAALDVVERLDEPAV